MSKSVGKPFEILLVEDNPADVRLTKEALREGKIWNNLHVATDGFVALNFLYRRGDEYVNAPRPDLILLDLNLPKKDGREVLAVVKADESLRSIPIVVLTTSQADEDVASVYGLSANCYISKPVDFDNFSRIVRSIEEFWFTVVSRVHK